MKRLHPRRQQIIELVQNLADRAVEKVRIKKEKEHSIQMILEEIVEKVVEGRIEIPSGSRLSSDIDENVPSISSQAYSMGCASSPSETTNPLPPILQRIEANKIELRKKFNEIFKSTSVIPISTSFFFPDKAT